MAALLDCIPTFAMLFGTIDSKVQVLPSKEKSVNCEKNGRGLMHNMENIAYVILKNNNINYGIHHQVIQDLDP